MRWQKNDTPQTKTAKLYATLSHYRFPQTDTLVLFAALLSLPRPADALADVPSGHVYLVSDNRQFPWDSREFGPVERTTCAETVFFRLVSKDGFFDVANRLTVIR